MCSGRLENKRPALLHGGERGGTGNFFKQLELLRLAFSQHGRFFIEIIRDGFEPRSPLVNDDAKKHAFAFHLRMNLANDEAVFVDIPVEPSDEEPVPGFLSAIARVAQIKHDFEVRAEKFFDDGKDGGFHFGKSISYQYDFPFNSHALPFLGGLFHSLLFMLFRLFDGFEQFFFSHLFHILSI